MLRTALCCFAAVIVFTHCAAAQTSSASLTTVRQEACPEARSVCGHADAIVFVHGIFGNDGTFTNTKTGFNLWKNVPNQILGRGIDVFRINYQSALFAWAKGSSPQFNDLSVAIYNALTPLRKRQYRTIGFVAHSLGGNIVTTYLYTVKIERGHPAWAQHAYVIMLGTPLVGAQIADIAHYLKSSLFMKDDLLNSLRSDNLYLRMLQTWGDSAFQFDGGRAKLYGCRPIALYGGYEEGSVGNVVKVVSEKSAKATPFREIKGFPYDHLQLPGPESHESDVYQWIISVISKEFKRAAEWGSQPLCKKIPYIPE